MPGTYAIECDFMADTNEEQRGEDEGRLGNMGFLGHLEELRKRIIYAVLGIAAGCIIASLFGEFIISDIVLAPVRDAGMQMQNLRPMGQPFFYFKIILVAGVIIGFPFVLHQLWKFVSPGLYDSERRWASRITFLSSLCFIVGILFAYYVMMPLMLGFAASMVFEGVSNDIEINFYFSFLAMTVLSAGLIFELPMVSWVLARIGILKPKFLRTYRRHAYVLILIIAAILTPSPDPVGQLTFAIPVVMLYELSVVITKFAAKPSQEGEQAAVSS